MKSLNLKNQRFGKLIITSLSDTKKCNQRYWNYSCDCGNKGLASTGNLMKKAVQSCGCSRLTNLPRGEDHWNWTGNKVGYDGLHSWVKRYKQKPQKCESCSLVFPLDLANISQEYKRDLTDWEWLCRKCHMKKDGRYQKYSLGISYRGKQYGI